MVSQMAHAKDLGEPFMAHLENLYYVTYPAFTISRGLISIDSFSMELSVLVTEVLCSKLLTLFNRDW